MQKFTAFLLALARRVSLVVKVMDSRLVLLKTLHAEMDDARLSAPGSKVIPFNAARGLLATDRVIFNHGQMTWTTPELAPPSPNYHTTPTGGRFSSRQI
ncbi:hypothetical protein TNCV_2898121 [Trichonephila clavipes]|nr:hypothetical protein TNCV_2898121 [Trichonephila clavipes]